MYRTERAQSDTGNVTAGDQCLQPAEQDPLTTEARLVLQYVLRMPIDTAQYAYQTQESLDPNLYPGSEIAEFACIGSACLELQRRGNWSRFIDGYVPSTYNADAIIRDIQACITVLDMDSGKSDLLASGGAGQPLASLFMCRSAVFAQLYDRKGIPRALVVATQDENEVDALASIVNQLAVLAEVEQPDVIASIERADSAAVHNAVGELEVPRGFFFIADAGGAVPKVVIVGGFDTSGLSA